jgi:hypothetical protein
MKQTSSTVSKLTCLCVLLILINACTDQSLNSRKQSVTTPIQQAGWQAEIINTSTFPIQAFLPTPSHIKQLSIYPMTPSFLMLPLQLTEPDFLAIANQN